MIKLRDYQIDISTKAQAILEKYLFVVLSLEVRTGKTIISLETAKKCDRDKVLFLTKKKAISSIEADYEHYKDDFELQVMNYESLHHIKDNDFDLIILDESHSLGTFPKPNNKYKEIKKRFGDVPMILLSGTMSPESYSQYYHQITVSNFSPWNKYKNFYRWCDDFVKIKQIKTSYGFSNDYSNANYDKIMSDIEHLILTFTQKEAGFTTEIDEKVLYVKMKPFIYDMVKTLQTDKVIEGKDEVILADTMVKEKQKCHQLYSGTIKFESGNSKILDTTKADFIKEHFAGKKIGIFYNFKAERELLKQVFGDTICESLEEFNGTDKNIMLQIVSGREGISLKEADCLVYFNISFSATSYWQSRDRLTTIDRTHNTVYWVFAEGGLEDDIYKAVQDKKTFTTKLYERTTNTKKDNRLFN